MLPSIIFTVSTELGQIAYSERFCSLNIYAGRQYGQQSGRAAMPQSKHERFSNNEVSYGS